MKRMILSAALLCVASACAAPPPAENTANANRASANPNANVAATPAAALVTEADALARENQVYDAMKAKNYDAFGALLADDLVYVNSDGVHDKAASVKGISSFAPTAVTLSEVKLVNVDKDLYVISYKARIEGTAEGKPLPPDHAERASTAWINRGGKWLAVYHQETIPREPPPAVAASPSASPAAAASPAASPAAAATGIDREKHIWDMLKRGDFDGFAAFIAPDQVEVEPVGVFNRAQSIEGVKQLDFKNVTLSDFKEVNLDADAALVTYLVKSPARGFNPAGERHTTIWVNRDGKWLAVFHQGTDAEE